MGALTRKCDIHNRIWEPDTCTIAATNEVEAETCPWCLADQLSTQLRKQKEELTMLSTAVANTYNKTLISVRSILYTCSQFLKRAIESANWDYVNEVMAIMEKESIVETPKHELPIGPSPVVPAPSGIQVRKTT